MQLLKFEQPKCHPCAALQAYLDYNNVEVTHIDIEQEQDKAVEWKVMSLPTLVLLDDEGKEVDRVRGFDRPRVVDLVARFQ